MSVIEITFNATRREFPMIWPVAFLWKLIMLLVWRGIIGPVRYSTNCAWRWLGRGRVDWAHWSPRVGDRVSACVGGVGIVQSVSIWHDRVRLTSGHECSLRNCCEPVGR